MQPSTIAEAAVTLALAVLFTWPVRAHLRTLLTAVPRRYALSCATGVALLFGGHMTNRGDATYPLVGWDMYTISNPADPRFVDYIAVLASGREQRLLIGQLFPAGGRHFRARIDEAAFAVERSQPGSREGAVAHLDTMLTALARVYGERHPADAVRAIRLWIATVPAQDYRGPGSITRTFLHAYRAP